MESAGGPREQLLAPNQPPRTLSDVANLSSLPHVNVAPKRLLSPKPLLGLTSGLLLSLAVIALVSIAVLAGSSSRDSPLCRKSAALAVMGPDPGGNLSAQLLLWSGMGEHRPPLDDLHTFNLEQRNWEARSTRRHVVRPLPRWKEAAAQVAGGMVVFGGDAFSGRFSHTYEADLWLMDPSLAWKRAVVTDTTAHSTPTPRRAHSLVAYQDTTGGDRIVAFGGQQHGEKIMNDVWEARIAWPNATWQRLHPGGDLAPAPRKGHTAVLVDDAESPLMLVYGGRDNEKYHSDLWGFDILASKWQPLHPGTMGVAPAPRDHHSAAYFRGRLFIYGGRSGTTYDNSRPMGDLWSFDMRKLVWQQEPQGGLTPLPRFLNSLARYTPAGSQDLRVVVFGGETLQGCRLNDVWELSLGSLLWTQLSPPDFCTLKCRAAFQGKRVAAPRGGRRACAMGCAAALSLSGATPCCHLFI